MISALSQHQAFKWTSLLIACLTFVATGCSHRLEVRNLHAYKPDFVDSALFGSKIGLSASTNTPEEERLVTSAANNLKKNGFQVVYPFYPNEENKNAVDFIIEIKTSSQYKGSGWNFLINWPGFLIWTPAWHGYNYRAIYGFDVGITDTKTSRTLPTLSIPMDLVIRHAAMNRTWTEISWLEWSAIAFIGGIVFTRYDKSVTPLLIDAIENKAGDYIAGKITRAIVSTTTLTEVPIDKAASKAMEVPLQKQVTPTAVPVMPGQILPPTAGEPESKK